MNLECNVGQSVLRLRTQGHCKSEESFDSAQRWALWQSDRLCVLRREATMTRILLFLVAGLFAAPVWADDDPAFFDFGGDSF